MRCARKSSKSPRTACARRDFLNRIGVATTGYREISDAASPGRALAGLTGRAVPGERAWKATARARSPCMSDTAGRRSLAAHGRAARCVGGLCRFPLRGVGDRGARRWTARLPPTRRSRTGMSITSSTRRSRRPCCRPRLSARPTRSRARSPRRDLDLVGVLAVEMLVTTDGRLLVNELAPRPHNSGHWTIDACITSQFEQLVRALCGLPLGSTERHANAVMKNLIGDEVETWREAIADPAARLHLYGKRIILPGRKMGHGHGCCRAGRPPLSIVTPRRRGARVSGSVALASRFRGNDEPIQQADRYARCRGADRVGCRAAPSTRSRAAQTAGTAWRQNRRVRDAHDQPARARNKQAFERGVAYAHMTRHAEAVEPARQADIGDHEIEGIFPRSVRRPPAGRRRRDLEPGRRRAPR